MSLTARGRELQEENERLQEENKRLKAENQQLKDNSKRLQAQLRDCRETVDMSHQVMGDWRARVKIEPRSA